MCGLAVLVNPGKIFDPAELAVLDSALYHRGPDSGGQLRETGVGMVFRRLAIMDPTAESDQPMTDDASGISLVFNGEIYNFREIRRRLEQQGEKFTSNGDSEVILKGYSAWGEEIFDRLEGMYAICLLDRKKNRLLAARDPLGIKPLYMARKGKRLGFSSEVRALTPQFGKSVDEDALPELLTFGWAGGAYSNYRGISTVAGGTLIKVDLEDGRVEERRFFDPLSTLEAPQQTSEEQVHEAVLRSLEAHLMSDVGYGLQLSGGIDSSLVAALASEISGKSLDSYAVQVDDQRFDEGEYRKPVVEKYGLVHSEHQINGNRFADLLPHAIAHMEGPVPHGGCVTLFSLCRQIAKNHKVVLTGEGADEMFGGYLRFAIWKKLQRQETVDRLWPGFLPVPDIWPLKGVKKLRGQDYAANAALYENISAMSAVFPDLLPAPPGAREGASRRFRDFRDRLFATDQSVYLQSLLVRQDKMSMAQSVEARVPFVHLPLLQAVNGLPHEVRVPGEVTKPVLKRLAERFLPHDLIHRRKVGLLLPYADWASDPAGFGRYLDDIADPNGQLRTYADGKRLDAVISDFRKGVRHGLPRIFSLINMELWLRSVNDA